MLLISFAFSACMTMSRFGYLVNIICDNRWICVLMIQYHFLHPLQGLDVHLPLLNFLFTFNNSTRDCSFDCSVHSLYSTSPLAAGQYGVTLLCSMLCLRKYSVNSFAINCGPLSAVIFFGYPKIANVFSRLLRTLLAVTDFITAATGYLDL